MQYPMVEAARHDSIIANDDELLSFEFHQVHSAPEAVLNIRWRIIKSAFASLRQKAEDCRSWVTWCMKKTAW